MTGSGSGTPSDSKSEWKIEKGNDIIELDGTTGVVSAKKAGTAEVAKRVKGGVAACVIEVSGYAVEQITVKGRTGNAHRRDAESEAVYHADRSAG